MLLKWWSSSISIFIQIWPSFEIRKYKILSTLSYCKQLWWFVTIKKNLMIFLLFFWENREFCDRILFLFLKNIFGNLVRICPWINHLKSLHGNYFGWPHFQELFLLEVFACWIASKQASKGPILLKSQFSLRRRLWGGFPSGKAKLGLLSHLWDLKRDLETWRCLKIKLCSHALKLPCTMAGHITQLSFLFSLFGY
jgi:hypothetical protein